MKIFNLPHLLLVVFLGIFTLSGCASTSHQEGTGEYLDNTAITSQIKTDYAFDPDIRSLNISVKTYKGHVLLTGEVQNAYQKRKAVDIARHVNGVKSVEDRLVITNFR